MKYVTACVFSTNSTCTSHGFMDTQCLIYLDRVWSRSKPIQTAGPKIKAREGGYSRSEMRAFKWNMNSIQFEWIPLAPQSRKPRKGFNLHLTHDEVHDPKRVS